MKYLFFIEPLIELNKPEWKKFWASHIVSGIINALSNNSDILIITNPQIAKGFSTDIKERIKLIEIEQSQLLDNWSYNYLEITKYGQLNKLDLKMSQYLKSLYSKHLNDFRADHTFTFSPCSYIQELLPQSEFHFVEFGLFSRAPYPQSYYLDKKGMLGNQSWKNFSKDIAKLEIPKEDKEQLIKLKTHFNNLIKEKSPYKIEKVGFKKLILLPLQFDNFYLIDSYNEFNSQFDYLHYIMENLPSDYGVMVTCHPEYNILTKELVSYFKGKYPNFIFHEDFSLYYSSSQYLLSLCDYVITISSSIALQALLWDCQVINLATEHIFPFANFYKKGEELDFSKENTDKEKWLYWLLKYYYIPEEFLFSKDFLNLYLQPNNKEDFNSISHGIEFSKIVETYIKSTDHSIPHKNMSYVNKYRTQDLLNEKDLEIERLTKAVKHYQNEVNELELKIKDFKIQFHYRPDQVIYIKDILTRKSLVPIFNFIIQSVFNFRILKNKVKGLLRG